MKRIVLFIILGFLVSCSTQYDIEPLSEEESKNKTTIRLQEMQKDTVLISIDKNYVYIFDDELNLVNKLTTVDMNKTIPVRSWWVFFSSAILVLFFMFFVTWIIYS